MTSADWVNAMFLPRLDPQTASALAVPAGPQDPISRGARRAARARAGACAALSAPATAALALLGFADSGFWIAAVFVASLAVAYIGSTVVLLRADPHPAEPSLVPAAERGAYQDMRDLHPAEITGISRSLGRAVATELQQLLEQIERRWTALAAQQGAARHEEGRLRADYPWTPEQHARIGALSARCARLAERAGALAQVSRDIPGRIAALADNPARRVESAALQLAMIEAQARVDDICAA
ncbi:MAG: hypothetical protein LBQ06_00035 [Frankiaceae bacterium]|jgi:hypothetical protein|nr:hypothetical protein [Frankiaceae bacterium]